MGNQEKESLEYGKSKRVHRKQRRERQFGGWVAESAAWLWEGEAFLGIKRAYRRRISDQRTCRGTGRLSYERASQHL